MLPAAAYPQFNVDYYIREGLNNIQDSRYNAAIQRFTTIINVKTDMWQPLFLRGVAKYYLGDYHGAIGDFDAGLVLNPYFSELYLFRGISSQLLNDYATARLNYEQALSLDPANASVYSNLGLIELLSENYLRGKDFFTKAIETKPDYGDAYLFRALCLSELKDSKQAFVDFDNALRYNKFDERIYLWRGKLQYDLKDFDASIRDFNKAISFNEQNPLLYYYRATVRYEKHDLDGCIADFSKAIELNPGNELVYYNRALVRAEVGLSNGAEDDYNKVVQLDPRNLLGRFNRGLLRLELHNLQGAEEDFTAAINIYPQFYHAYLARAEVRMSMKNMRGANADHLAAAQIKKANRGGEFGDTAQFKKLITFDADFVNDSHGQLLALKKLMKSESSSLFAGDFMLGIEVENAGLVYYYFPYLQAMNKREKSRHPFAMIRRADTVYWTELSKLSSRLDTLYSEPRTQRLVQGISAALQSNYNAATNSFSEIIASHPQYVPALFDRAYTRAAVVEMLSSFDDMQQEVSVISKNEELNKRAVPRQRQVYRDYIDVLEDYRAVLTAEPGFYFAHYNMGNVQAKMQNYQEATLSYSKALETNPEFAEAYYNRGLARLYMTDTAAACIDFSKAGQYGFSDVYPILRKSCAK